MWSGKPLVVELQVRGTATAGTDYLALPATATIPAYATLAYVSTTTIQEAEVKLSETVDLVIKPSLEYQIADTRTRLSIADDDVRRLRSNRAWPSDIDDDDVGSIGGRVYPEGTTMNPLATDQNSAAADSPDNCQSWTFNAAGLFQNRPIRFNNSATVDAAIKHGIFDAEDADVLSNNDIDFLYSDASIMKRALEALLYDYASPIQGYRCYATDAIPFNATTKTGWHMITAYWRNTIIGYDYHYATNDYDPVTATWNHWSDKESDAKVVTTDPYKESGTFSVIIWLAQHREMLGRGRDGHAATTG